MPAADQPLPRPSQIPISVVINTRNAADTLQNTLDSVSWAAEIIVMDMQSGDETVTIARQAGARIFSCPDYGFVEKARNQALAHATYPWTLIVDADEEVSVGLARVVAAVVQANQAAFPLAVQLGESSQAQVVVASAYFIARLNYIFKRAFRHTGWWPDYQLRLFKTGTVTWLDQIHSVPTIVGTTAHLPADPAVALIHHNYRSVAQYLERSNRYSTIQAQEKIQAKVMPTFTESAFIKAWSNEFFARFFAQKGDLDGTHGLTLALLQSFSELSVFLKQWEGAQFPALEQLGGSEGTALGTGIALGTAPGPTPDTAQASGPTPDWFAALRGFQGDLNYWLADWKVAHTRGLTQLWWRWRRRWHW